MRQANWVVRAGLLVSLIASTFTAGCYVVAREGDYDREHHRWYHDHEWRACDRDDEHCRDRDHNHDH